MDLAFLQIPWQDKVKFNVHISYGPAISQGISYPRNKYEVFLTVMNVMTEVGSNLGEYHWGMEKQNVLPVESCSI